jgi:hypothetical protein
MHSQINFEKKEKETGSKGFEPPAFLMLAGLEAASAALADRGFITVNTS